MITKRIIPCLDVKDNRVVKGTCFQNLKDVGDPVELALEYQAQGADELVLLDITATLENRRNRVNLISKIRQQLSIPLTVGGAVRSLIDIQEILSNGADKVAINSAAIEDPQFIQKAANKFGSQCIVVSVDSIRNKDVANSWKVVTKSGTNITNIDTIDWIKKVTLLGAGEILLTSFDKDGTQSGYDLELTQIASNATNIPVIASGGAKVTEDLFKAFHVGADAVLAASIFHISKISVKEIKAKLKNMGIEVRI